MKTRQTYFSLFKAWHSVAYSKGTSKICHSVVGSPIYIKESHLLQYILGTGLICRNACASGFLGFEHHVLELHYKQLLLRKSGELQTVPRKMRTAKA